MAKIKIKNAKQSAIQLRTKLRIAITKLLQSKDLRNKIGKIISEDIKARDFGEPSDRTYKWRQRYDKLNKTDPSYSRGKINVTFTGELLKDLASNVIADTTKKQFIVANSDNLHKKYQGVTKKLGKKRAKFSEIAEGLIKKMGYDYLSFNKETQNKITRLLQQELNKILR